MKIVRYFISLALFFALFTVALLSFGGKIAYVADLPSALFIVLLPVCMLRASWTFREMLAAFKAPLASGASRRDLEKSVLFFSQLQRYALYFGILCFLISCISILCNLEDAAYLGLNTATALIGCLYAVLLCLIIAFPLKSAALKQLKEESRHTK